MGAKKAPEPELPKGFVYESSRIKHWKGPDDNPQEIIVCGKFQCNGATRDEEGASYGKEIEFISDDGKRHVVVVSNAELQGDAGELRKKLADQGLWISTNRSARESFSQLLNTIWAPQQIVTVSKAGWHADGAVFVSPVGHVIHEQSWPIQDEADDTPVKPDEGLKSVIYRLDPNRGVQDKRAGGSYRTWKSGVGDPIFQTRREPGTKIDHLMAPHFVLGLLTGCAGTVIQYVGEPSSGLHFVGGSSRGKSTAQVVGASCWANPAPDKGVLITCRGTSNALDMKFVLSNGVSLHLDEARTGDEKTIANLPFQFAGETVKARLRADSALRKVLTWKGFMTLSSEKAIGHYAARAGDQVIAGGVVRMPSIDISGLPPIDPNDARIIKEVALANYGHVGPRFAQALSWKSPREVRAMIDAAESELSTANSTPTVMRARRVFATLYVVGQIMKKADIISADELHILRAVRWGWNAFLTGEESAALNPAEQSVDALILWLRSNPNVVRRAGDKFGHQEVLAWYDEGTVYLPKTNLPKIKALSTSAKAVLEEFDSRGQLAWSGKNRVWPWIPRVGDVPHYRLHITIDVTGESAEEQEVIEVVRDLGGNEFTRAAASA